MENEWKNFLVSEIRKASQLKKDAEKTNVKEDTWYANGYYDALYYFYQKVLKKPESTKTK